MRVLSRLSYAYNIALGDEWMAHSAIFHGDLGAWLHQQIPNSKLVMFEQSGHCPFSEAPEKFNREVAAFVG